MDCDIQMAAGKLPEGNVRGILQMICPRWKMSGKNSLGEFSGATSAIELSKGKCSWCDCPGENICGDFPGGDIRRKCPVNVRGVLPGENVRGGLFGALSWKS